MNSEITQFIHSIQDEIIGFRRHIHQNPELSFEEYQTSEFIYNQLSKLGLQPKRIGTTGVVAIIQNDRHDISKGCVGFRADIDALPILEKTALDFSSKNEGVMHACGHDIHSSILLGVAKTLVAFKELLKEPVKIIFQPGEEKLPGGASILIEEGVLENPKVNRIYALHVAPELRVGQIGWKKGVYMASCDEIYIDIHGKGGHGALPQNCVDPITIGASLVMNLQQVISRKGDPKIPSVLTIGHFEALGATNVIPAIAKLKGTFRTFNEEWRAQAHQWIEKYTKQTVEAAGGTVDITIEKGYPFLKNHEEVTEQFVQNIAENMKEIELIPLDIRMTSEDFSYYSQKIPACFFRLGTSNEDSTTHFGVHHPQFIVDESAIAIGIQAFCNQVL